MTYNAASRDKARQDTRKVLAEMLKEDTGRHFLDSGGYYGRAWERNQGRDFESESPAGLSFKHGELEISLNVFHFLADRLTYAPKLDAALRRFMAKHPDDYGIAVAGMFAESLKGSGLYGDGKPMTVNTYNGEDLLSQTIQYVYTETEEHGALVILQIHGGCDVRGGYTEPRVFFAGSGLHEKEAIFDNARATIYCEGTEDNQTDLFRAHAGHGETVSHHWSTDDSYHFYYDGSTGYTQLGEYERTEDESLRGKGVLYVDEDGRGYCPMCGAPLLAGD